MEIRENVPLSTHAYYKIGGPARYFAQPENENDLGELSVFLNLKKMPYYILGAGSNVLFDDAGFEGLVLQTGKLNPTLNTQTPGTIDIGCSVMVIQLLRVAMKEGYSGLECLVGIPGNLGGVFYMNAGTALGEIKDLVLEVQAYNLKTAIKSTFSKEELNYSYRKQHFLKSHDLITGGKIRISKSTPQEVQSKITELLDKRKKAQPIDKPSCGSVFKNPPQHAAWKLIDQAGLRGHRIGNAQVSPMHSNFIVNLGGAKASDVRDLILECKQKVFNQSGIQLEEEVKIISPSGGERF